MPTGGFKAFQVELTGLGSSAPLADKKNAASNLLKEIGQRLVALNQGWSYDDGMSETPSAYPEGDFSTYTNPQTIYNGFKHISGAKLLLAYNIYNNAYNTGNGFSLNSYINCGGSTTTPGRSHGLCASIIPSGSYTYSSGSPISGNQIRLASNLTNYNTSASSFLYNASEGAKARYTFIVNGTKIIIVFQNNYNTSIGFNKNQMSYMILGNIISGTSSDDTFEGKGFALIDPNNGFSSNTSENQQLQIKENNGNRCFLWNNSYPDYQEFYSYDGTLLQGNVGMSCASIDVYVVASNNSPTNSIRYFPINVFTRRANGCQENGDGYKGIVEPSVAACINTNALPIGTLLDGGRMIVACGGIVLGWDSSNTVTFD